MAYPTWPSMKRSSPTNVQRKFSGINTQDSMSIKEEFASDTVNCSSENYPSLTTRVGYTMAGGLLGDRVLGLGVWKENELHAISDSMWQKYDGAAWQPVTGGGSLSASANWSFTNFKGNLTSINLIGANGTDPIKRYDGSMVQSLTGAPTGGNYIESFAQRLWCCVGNELHGSALDKADEWETFDAEDSSSYVKTLDTLDGETINAIKAGNTHLTIFKPNSIHELFGFNPSDYNTLPVTFDVGAASDQAIANVEGVFYFIHRTGLYKYSGGTLPDKEFSKPIQDLINRINPEAIQKCCSGTNGKYVYFGIPVDDATDPDTIIEYNTEYGIFNIWNGFSPLNMNDILGTLYIGNATGQVRKVGGDTDNGASISASWTSKVFGGPSYSQRLRWKRAWIVADIRAGATLNVYLSFSTTADDFVLVQSISSILGSTRIIIPTTVVSNTVFIRVKFAWTGKVTINEWSREEEALPIF